MDESHQRRRCSEGCKLQGGVDGRGWKFTVAEESKGEGCSGECKREGAKCMPVSVEIKEGGMKCISPQGGRWARRKITRSRQLAGGRAVQQPLAQYASLWYALLPSPAVAIVLNIFTALTSDDCLLRWPVRLKTGRSFC